jgi:hypothetical protein
MILTFGIVLACVAVLVATVPILIMVVSDHRHLYGSAKWWTRRHHRGAASSPLDTVKKYNQTSQEHLQKQV